MDIDPVEYDLEYMHRWTKKYDNHLLCRLYNLEWYFRLNPNKTPKFTMMVTLTGKHASSRSPKKGGLKHMAYLAKFHITHRKSEDFLRKYLQTVLYLSMLESHPESGYVYAHDQYFLDESPSQKTLTIIENHWNNTLEMGSSEQGITIEIKEPRDFKDKKSFIAYPIAFVGKALLVIYPNGQNPMLFSIPVCGHWPERFGGIGHRIRAFQPSRVLSQIMNPPSAKEGYIHIESILTHKIGFDAKTLYQFWTLK